MAEANCPICLERLRSPVIVPCGHLHCATCLMTHIQSGTNAMKSTCPTCRAAFYIVIPDLRSIPAIYQPFIHPSIRRVYLDTSVPDGLRSEISDLEARLNHVTRESDEVHRQFNASLREHRTLRGRYKRLKDQTAFTSIAGALKPSTAVYEMFPSSYPLEPAKNITAQTSPSAKENGHLYLPCASTFTNSRRGIVKRMRGRTRKGDPRRRSHVYPIGR